MREAEALLLEVRAMAADMRRLHEETLLILTTLTEMMTHNDRNVLAFRAEFSGAGDNGR